MAPILRFPHPVIIPRDENLDCPVSRVRNKILLQILQFVDRRIQRREIANQDCMHEEIRSRKWAKRFSRKFGRIAATCRLFYRIATDMKIDMINQKQLLLNVFGFIPRQAVKFAAQNSIRCVHLNNHCRPYFNNRMVRVLVKRKPEKYRRLYLLGNEITNKGFSRFPEFKNLVVVSR